MEKEEGLDKDMTTQKMVSNLDKFYLFSKLKHTTDMFAQGFLYGKQFKYHLIEPIMGYLKDNLNQYEDSPAIIIYYQNCPDEYGTKRRTL